MVTTMIADIIEAGEIDIENKAPGKALDFQNSSRSSRDFLACHAHSSKSDTLSNGNKLSMRSLMLRTERLHSVKYLTRPYLLPL